MYDVCVLISGKKMFEMGAKDIERRKVYPTTILQITEMSRGMLFHTGNAHTSFKS